MYAHFLRLLSFEIKIKLHLDLRTSFGEEEYLPHG